MVDCGTESLLDFSLVSFTNEFAGILIIMILLGCGAPFSRSRVISAK